MRPDARIETVNARAYTIPTDRPEADGTFEWTATTLVLVRLHSGGTTGLGFTYGDAATAELVRASLAERVMGMDALEPTRGWDVLRRALRNTGARGIGAAALSAIDLAWWDLKARLLGLPLVRLLGARRDAAPVYGSGGFTSYSMRELTAQLTGWVEAGIPRVKMKIGTHPEEDPARVEAARKAIGASAELFVDANGAFRVGEAIAMAHRLARFEVSWFEEPVSSDDRVGLRELRARAPPAQSIAAGEYGWEPTAFRDLLFDRCVDVLQADVTRCGGITGFLEVAALCEAFGIPLSGHTAPSMHLHVALAAPALRHLEYFHDHVRIEQLLFEGVARPSRGELRADLQRPGHGLELKESVANDFAR